MSVVKSFSVGNGDTFYIDHNSDNFTIIDCNLNDSNADDIIDDMKARAAKKGISRFISTHPDQDHFGGIEILDARLPIANFYVVKNSATKDDETTSFLHYCGLRDGDKAFCILKNCARKWMNQEGEGRGTSGISILWPNRANTHFQEALSECNAGEAFNNVSAVIRYSVEGGASFMWLGDLDTDFMENITNDIYLPKTTIVFASHHGRSSGKIPDAWLEKLDPQIIIIGEAPSRHLHYYTGYKTITQNRAWDVTFDAVENKVHIYSSNPKYSHDGLDDEGKSDYTGYVGSITVETEYTL